MGAALSSLLSEVQDKGQEGCMGQVDLNSASAALDLLSSTGMVARVELRLSARGLPKKDKLSQSDPMAVLYRAAATGQTQWAEAGRTNVVANMSDPEWVKPILERYTADAAQPMKVVIYDVDSIAKKPEALSLASQDYIGEVEFALSDLMKAPGGTLELPLVDLQQGRALPPGCVVVFKAEPMSSSDNRVIRFAFAATGLMGKVGPATPALRISRLRQGSQDDWVPVARTEVRDKNSDPVWQPMEIDIRQLCSADEARPLKLEVWDWSSKGTHVLLGEHRTTLAQLKELGGGSTGSAAKMLDLSLPGGGSATGRLMLRQCMVKPGPTASQNLAGCLQGCLG
ncbi:BONZAI 3-like isoform X1 isoform A [Micractinium conductrix]|uniref:BONZAI 3-like isoform X1 isoform A n=1 Tax=Micractinium conductrix TaxID=554055 RepID=A0A2P6VPD8_9CHLO|nr:BONZAI 3-like isoform X1 isoform B [Micractinium conductrix]PSC75963.1 BONZAI 3-like isoform X1 isoform A [Micractinium conductrix]|eukprot:PSC75962.1 BONZAI 3-like isoform X1 isoform B [Micractinium conductrix]